MGNTAQNTCKLWCYILVKALIFLPFTQDFYILRKAHEKGIDKYLRECYTKLIGKDCSMADNHMFGVAYNTEDKNPKNFEEKQMNCETSANYRSRLDCCLLVYMFRRNSVCGNCRNILACRRHFPVIRYCRQRVFRTGNRRYKSRVC